MSGEPHDFKVSPTKITIAVGPAGGFSVKWGDASSPTPLHVATELTFDEMLGQIARLTGGPQLRGRLFEDNPEQEIRWGRVPSGYAAVILPAEQMQFFSDRLSDLGCWISGFKAALEPDRYDRAPLCGEYVTEINLKLKSAIEKVKA